MSIHAEIRVLSFIATKPRSVAAVHAWWRGAPGALTEILKTLQAEGAIACTNGIYWRRNSNSNSNRSNKHGSKARNQESR